MAFVSDEPSNGRAVTQPAFPPNEHDGTYQKTRTVGYPGMVVIRRKLTTGPGPGQIEPIKEGLR
jgi:hypothetical protein